MDRFSGRTVPRIVKRPMTFVRTRVELICVATALVLAGLASAASGQTPASSAKPSAAPPRPAAIATDEAIELTNGWALLAQGMPDQAAARAAKVLAAYPRSAAAIVLAVEAALAYSGFSAGLSQYEKWLASRTVEEPSIVRRLALALLRETAHDTRASEARIEALRILAAERDEDAIRILSSATLEGRIPETRVVAAQGNDLAVKTLIANLDNGGMNPVTSIEALAASGSALAIPALSKRLQDPSPEVRAAAVEGLTKLGRRDELVAQIKPLLNDRVSFVRVKAAGALFRLGDTSGEKILQDLMAEEAPVSHLVALQATASQPTAQWQDRVRRLTSATEPEIRVGAAKLLLPYDPETARKVLEAAASDPNSAIRGMAETTVVDLAANDLRALRHLLRSTNDLARVRAAGQILTLVR
jgi:HEAT repeat protein